MTVRKLSRRVALRGGVAAAALTASVAVGAVTVKASEKPDAELLRRVRAAEKSVSTWRYASAEAVRLRKISDAHPDCPSDRDRDAALYVRDMSAVRAWDEVQQEHWKRTGVRAAYDRREKLHKKCDAGKAVFALQPVTLAGVMGKLRVALLYLTDDDLEFCIEENQHSYERVSEIYGDLDRLAGVS